MIYSAGIIPFRKNENGKIEFFVGHPGGADDKCKNYWAYLKGGVEEGEEWVDTALREFNEESGLNLADTIKEKLIPLGTTRQNRYKIVVAFGLEYSNINPDDCHSNISDDGISPEIDKYAWFTLEELEDKTHPTHIDFYKQIISLVE